VCKKLIRNSQSFVKNVRKQQVAGGGLIFLTHSVDFPLFSLKLVAHGGIKLK